MTSQVLYRKWRPVHFQDVVGQEPITQTLEHALAQDRVAHAYLFCGPRGTGKTTTARILARAINCTSRQNGEPCDNCQSCQMITQGKALDLIEIDAASHRGIDDIRALQERVHYAPSESRYKVYIIDEVHMLTIAAFNALLKTLEEPPPHVILVLATTEPQDVPNTIVSRCQRFDFRRISTFAIVSKLENLCIQEEINSDKETLTTIAKQSGGSLRDAINMLEQLHVSYGSALKLSHIRDLLGLAEEEHTLKLAEHILRKETSEGLKLINNIASDGVDLKQLRAGVVESLRAALLIKAAATDAIEQSKEVIERLTTITDMVETQDLLRALQLFGEPTRKGDETSLLSLELALVQATLKTNPQTTRQESEGKKLQSQSTPSSADEVAISSNPVPLTSPSFSEANALPKTRDDSEAIFQPPTKQQTTPESTPENLYSDSHLETSTTSEILTSTVDKNWNQIVQALSKTKGKRFMIGALMRGSRSHRLDGQSIILSFVNTSNMERLKEEIESPQGGIAVREVLSQILGSPFELKVELDETQDKSKNNSNSGHLVRTAIRMGARIVNEENIE